MNKRPIGIFDSGIGGLTVFKEIRKRFPREDIVYFGDTARVPYGPKSRHTVIEYSVQNARFLTQMGAKIIIVACNTSSAVAIPHLKKVFDLPVLGVIEPGARTAVKVSSRHQIGIIGTIGTINSKAYKTAIKNLDQDAEVFSQACPLFVSLVEEGWEKHQVTKLIIQEYLDPLLSHNIDTLVLGCTHYPVLKNQIRDVIGHEIKLVDSAEATADKLTTLLPEPATEGNGKERFFVSDDEERFYKIASRILDDNINQLKKVTLGESWYLHND